MRLWPFTAVSGMKLNYTVIAYWLFAALRIILTLMPQTGYIHPDEFFQSVEVLAGDIYEVEITRTWEFNSTMPIRSMLLPYITVGLPFMGIQHLHPKIRSMFAKEILAPYFLIIIPRLVITLLSFLCDYCLYQICQLYNQNFKGRMLILASSYVMLVYGTRTLSNTLELVLLSLLLLFVTKSMCLTDDIIEEQDAIDKKYKDARNIREKVFLSRQKRRLPQHSISGWVSISLITVAGIFNRPTFIVFAFAPLFFWLQRAMDVKRIGFQHFHMRMIVLCLGVCAFSTFFIAFDSIYYGYVTWYELFYLKISTRNFVIVPFNFVLYNMNSKNLAQHGLHPWYLHIFVNVPLLFGILGLQGLLSFFENVYRAITNTWVDRPRLLTVFGLMAATFILPVLILSLIPHQEPRFIIPVIIPLVFLQGHKLFSENLYQKAMLAIWFASNVAFVLFYGYLHQGGIYSALVHVKQYIELHSAKEYITVVFCNTYMPPAFLLLLPKLGRLSLTHAGWKYVPPNRISLHDLAGTTIENLHEDLVGIMKRGDELAYKSNVTHTMLLVMPTSRGETFKKHFTNHFNLTTLETFYPHVSMEFPPMTDVDLNQKRSTIYDFETMSDYVISKLSHFGLRLYKVKKNVYKYLNYL